MNGLITLIHPTRSRPQKSLATITKWIDNAAFQFQTIVSVDSNDPFLKSYQKIYDNRCLLISENRSCVDAINNAAKIAKGTIWVVVSDDTDCFHAWDIALLKTLEGKEDFILKTDDGIQDYIVTQTIIDRKYYERDGYIYNPEFVHQFADTYMTCVADIRGRLIYSKLKFPHLHYSYSGGKEMADELNRRNDATWMRGQDTFIKLRKQFTKEELSRINNRGMKGFLKQVGL